MQYYIVKKKINNIFFLSEQDEFHLVSVMRAKINDKLVCIYDKKHFLSKVSSIHPLEIESIKLLDSNNENHHNINLVIGLVKKQKWDLILQKSTELGVNRIIPFNFKNTIINIDDKKLSNKSNRWYSICKEASEQCRRNEIPIIESIENKLDNLEKYKSDLNIVCYENSIKLLSDILTNDKVMNKKSITIVIGSEGGFKEFEIDKLNDLGFNDVKICKQILRTETAVISTLSIVNFILGRGN